jgi:ankyrin repeat protein
MKHLLLTTIATVLLVGCGESEADRALLRAAGAGDIATVKQHLAAGVDVNVKGSSGGTPLHYATTKAIAELLIANGADLNAKDEDGETPLDAISVFNKTENADLCAYPLF